METLTEEIRITKYMPIPVALLMVILAVIYNQKGKKNKPKLSLKEVEEKLNMYQPEPLAPEEEIYIERLIPVNVENRSKQSFDKVQNLACNNYLNLVEDKSIKEAAENCIRTYGVGSCGPRGFYGTVDVHLDLESSISKFMGLEDTILYSYSLSTMSSVLIAYCKAGDMLFCDEHITLTSVEAIKVTKATIVYFKHNDMEDLEKKLIQHDKGQINEKTKDRKFLIIEGIYHKTGSMCPLPKLLALREKYMLRMFLDECVSFGAVGSHGRGVTEHYNIDSSEVDLIVGSLEFGLGSIGGFCVGRMFIIEHQRLSGLGYCFSASLPPFLSLISKNVIDSFETRPEIFTKLHKVCRDVHDCLSKIQNITLLSDPISPRKVFQSNKLSIEDVAKNCESRGLLVLTDPDSITFNVNLDMDAAFIEKLCEIIECCV